MITCGRGSHWRPDIERFHHIPVLLDEVVHWLDPQPGQTVVDATLGGGGHAHALAEALGADGHLIGIDQDPDAIAAATLRLANVPPRVSIHCANFRTLDRILADCAPEPGEPFVNAVLADLGVSSHQFDTGARGFSFQTEAPLDMRMSQAGPSAAELVASVEVAELASLLKTGGDVKRAYRVAQWMKEASARGELETTTQLRDLCERALGRPKRGQIHPATTVFQALRIAVNDELGALEQLLDAVRAHLLPGGRLGVITFHSGEDRIVKHTFRKMTGVDALPPGLPVTAADIPSEGRILTRKPVSATDEELDRNPRARSAKLRVFEFT